MVTIREVKTKKDIKRFIDFPTELYKGVKQYVHPLRMSEFENFDPKKNASFEDCEAVYYLAVDENDNILGRIAGIIQRLYNEKVNEKRVRFTRFDCVNSVEVAKVLFEAVENWAKEKGMNIVHGPMGFNDLDREGMLIEGFNEIATFEEAYNYEYYKDLMVACGYDKEIDWVEFNITVPKQIEPRIERLSQAVMKRYKLHFPTEKNKKKFIEKYKAGIFHVLDEAYGPLYGVVPYTDKVRDQVIDQFKLFISLDMMSVVLDENENVVAFGFVIPSLSEAINKCEGRLTPMGLIRVLKAVRHPKKADFALIAVKPELQTKGVTSLIMEDMIKKMNKLNVDTCETNLNLENNYSIQAMWKNFEHRQHKRRRSWRKDLNEAN